MDTDGKQFIPWEKISSDDIVIIPAFGTTLEIEKMLNEKGVDVQQYNTTCPFVEKVWNRSQKLGKDSYTVIIHGKPEHEETRATFSHSASTSPSVVIKDMAEAEMLCPFIMGEKKSEEFFEKFKGRFSNGFDPEKDFKRVGVVNQTTMLAKETQAIADYFKDLMVKKYGAEHIGQHFADTRDTLCYATNDNQDSTYQIMETAADLAIVVGGYNSSNTSHLVELCEQKFDTYFISSDAEIVSNQSIRHFNIHSKKIETAQNYLPSKRPLEIVLTSGASCPDTLVDKVMERLISFFPDARPVESVLEEFAASYN